MDQHYKIADDVIFIDEHDNMFVYKKQDKIFLANEVSNFILNHLEGNTLESLVELLMQRYDTKGKDFETVKTDCMQCIAYLLSNNIIS